MAQTYIGAPIRRKEDKRFLTGKGQFVDDVKLPNMLHGAILRSPHAHARILDFITGLDPEAQERFAYRNAVEMLGLSQN